MFSPDQLWTWTAHPVEVFACPPSDALSVPGTLAFAPYVGYRPWIGDPTPTHLKSSYSRGPWRISARERVAVNRRNVVRTRKYIECASPSDIRIQTNPFLQPSRLVPTGVPQNKA